MYSELEMLSIRSRIVLCKVILFRNDAFRSGKLSKMVSHGRSDPVNEALNLLNTFFRMFWHSPWSRVGLAGGVPVG